MTQYFDNTRVSAFKKCPRSFYFRHERHWRRDGTALPLVFGLAWHNAMDVVWSLVGKRSDDEVLALSMEAFYEVWEKEGLSRLEAMTPDENKNMAPRTPDTAMEMLYNYIQQRRDLITECEVLAIERPFAVPLSEDTDIMYIGRLDKEFKHGGRVITGEHKTTASYAKASGFRQDYIDSFSPNSQVDGYAHASHMIHGNKAKAVWVDIALVHKTVHDAFKFIPVERALAQLDAWLHETRDWIADIQKDKEALRVYRESGAERGFLPVFKKNTDSCFAKYGRCAFYDICRFTHNPEAQYPDDNVPPEGFVYDKWEPFDILGLEKLGIPREDKL